MAAPRYRTVTMGVVEQMPTGDLPRHYHREGYANVILSGSFVEAAFAGRADVEAGDVLLHGAFDAHADMGGFSRGPRILRLPWFDATVEGHFRLADPDLLVRLAERDISAALEALQDQLRSMRRHASTLSWPERLAIDLKQRPRFSLTDWADAHRLSPETVSRGFRRHFGVSPQRYRLEAKTREAWRRAIVEPVSLTRIAHEVGFADLAHMTRSIILLTGLPPQEWRRRHTSRAV
jgi:AraC-like DNA-binding protein